MVAWLERTPAYHGLFPHFMNGRTGATMPFGRKDDGSDLVETSFLFQGLLCARQYFRRATAAENDLRDRTSPGCGATSNGAGTRRAAATR